MVGIGGSRPLREMVWGCIKKDEGATGAKKKAAFFTGLCNSSCLQVPAPILEGLLFMMDGKLQDKVKSFLPRKLFVIMFYHIYGKAIQDSALGDIFFFNSVSFIPSIFDSHYM